MSSDSVLLDRKVGESDPVSLNKGKNEIVKEWLP